MVNPIDETAREVFMSIVDKIQSLNMEADEQYCSLVEALRMYHSLYRKQCNTTT